MKVRVAIRFALATAFASAMLGAQTQRALIVGINSYQPSGTTAEHPIGCIYGRCELGAFQNLDGAVNDASAMADLLTGPKFGFPSNHVTVLTNPALSHARPGVDILPAEQTTRDGILAAMQKYLVETPQRDDTVVFYVASHGSLRVNSKGNKLSVLVNGQYVHADSTLVPSDAYKGGYDIRDREMARIFNAALDKGIQLTVIFDSCHSGGISRGIGPAYRERALAFDPRDIAEAPDVSANGQPRPTPTERSDNPALVFSAAQQDQTAKEAPTEGAGSEAHGAFTAALVEALQVLPANSPASLVYARVKAVLEGSSVPDQVPDMDASAMRRQQPLFGGTAATSGKMLAAALGSSEGGSVSLDIGLVSGIGAGSEFTAIAPNAAGQTVVLRVETLDGLARSSASVAHPAGAKVAPGDVFELSKWVPADAPPFRIWLWPSSLSRGEIVAAVAQVRASGAALVRDPAEEPWTHVLNWDGTQWTLQKAGTPLAITLGARLTTDAIRRSLPAGSKLWVNMPPSKELAQKLVPAGLNSAVQLAESLAAAHYALVGTLTADGPAYSWYHKSDLMAGPPSQNVTPHSPGCSGSSSYPVRSYWVPVAQADAVAASGEKLAHYSSLLAKVHGWLELAESPASGSAGAYYNLALIPSTSSVPIAADQPVHQGDELRVALTSTERVVDRRWVYVLDIDCHGQGAVLYPRNNSENEFPNDAANGRQFFLPGAPVLRVGPPFGIDTLVLLSTAQPLTDPYMLNFEGVASTRGSRGALSPLEQLLSQTSSGTRGFSGEAPSNWGIGLTTVRSIPADIAK